MRVTVVGSGYVGLVTGACLASRGHDVVCVDVDLEKVGRINRGEPPIAEPGLAEMLHSLVPARLRATSDLAAAVRESDVTFVAVGTPFDGTEIDLTQVKEAAAAIGSGLRKASGFPVVVIKSTVVPGTTDGVVAPILEEHSGKRAGRDFGVAMNPEFLTEGQAVADFMCPDRIVLGGMDDRTNGVLEELYASFRPVPVLRTNPRTAEMIKYASNSLLATLISFSNEFANLCSATGDVDAVSVMEGVKLSRYFTVQSPGSEATRPSITAFLDAGCGYGGSCLPKDVRALTAYGARIGSAMPQLAATNQTNNRQPTRMLELLERHWPELAGLHVVVLGIAYKPGTDDMRESPAIPIVDALLARGAAVSAYDPMVPSSEIVRRWPTVRPHERLADAIEHANAVLIVTRWDEFRALPSLLADMAVQPLLVDGRRLLDRNAVARYEGIGL